MPQMNIASEQHYITSFVNWNQHEIENFIAD